MRYGLNALPCRAGWIIILSLLICCFSAADAKAQSAQEITVSAAISLKDAFGEIGKVFQGKHPGAKLAFNFGASGTLARQIEAGAPLDVFASAAQKDMDDLDRKGLLSAGSRSDFAGNAVVLVKPANSTLPISAFRDLLKRDVKKIVIGNPKTVPAGWYAKEVMEYLNLWPAIQDKLVFAENARQALDYVARNEVDAGFVYSTDAGIRAKEVKIIMTAPENSHQPIIYPIAAMKDTKAEVLARDFIQMVLSPQGQKILNEYGFQRVLIKRR
jgi:molybdate transport system substrate-binding protein